MVHKRNLATLKMLFKRQTLKEHNGEKKKRLLILIWETI